MGINRSSYGNYRNATYSEGGLFMDKKKREQMKNTLTATQEVRYNREFKMADRAGGFTSPKQSRS